MALTSMKEMLIDARKRGYVACYCESWNLESLQATVEAAEAEKSPIIVGLQWRLSVEVRAEDTPSSLVTTPRCAPL